LSCTFTLYHIKSIWRRPGIFKITRSSNLSKNTRGDKEYSKLQEMVHENKKLKREVASLRKQLARLDLDRHSYVRDIVEEHLSQEHEETTTTQMLASMKNEWQCNSCGTGYLEIHLYNRPDGTFYYRMCNNCKKRTAGQRYEPGKVRGIVKQNDN
jgi:hypothetical protein